MDWYGFNNMLLQLTWMGVAFGIVGYFFFRERNRCEENRMMMERMTPEQLADIRRVDAEIAAERKRQSNGNLRFLRFGMAITGGAVGCFVGLQCFLSGDAWADELPIPVFKTMAVSVFGIGLFIFLEFLIEVYMRRRTERWAAGKK